MNQNKRIKRKIVIVEIRRLDVEALATATQDVRMHKQKYEDLYKRSLLPHVFSYINTPDTHMHI